MAFMRVKETGPRHKYLITGSKRRILPLRNRDCSGLLPGLPTEQWRSGLARMAAMLRLQIPSVELKEENMRASMLALAGILVCSASAASAQAVIDVEGQRAAQPPAQDQRPAQPQPQIVPHVAPESAPQPTPKIESPVQSNDNGPAASAGGGRFTFNRIDNGFLRLDTQSGQVAYCRTQTAGWSCQAVPENRSELEADVARVQADMKDLKALKSDIVRLHDEISALRREVTALKEPPPPRPPADLTPPDKAPDVTIRLPTHEDVVRARAFIEKTWHRLVEMITAVQKDMMQKG